MANAGRLVKELEVQELTAALKTRLNFFVASVGNLKAVEADALRKQLRGVEARLLVMKRTLSLRGILPLKLNGGSSQLLQGSVAFVFPGEELAQAAKLVVQFARANEGKLIIRGGWVDGQLLDRAVLEELASLPPRPQLVARLIGAIEGPITDLIFTLEALLGELAWVIEEVAKAREKTGNQ